MVIPLITDAFLLFPSLGPSHGFVVVQMPQAIRQLPMHERFTAGQVIHTARRQSGLTAWHGGQEPVRQAVRSAGLPH